MVTHRLKCWSPYFDAIERGDKNFEVRRDDRGYQRGDILVLEKFDPIEKQYVFSYSTGSPIFILRRIMYILTGGHFGIEAGYVVMGLENEDKNIA